MSRTRIVLAYAWDREPDVQRYQICVGRDHMHALLAIAPLGMKVLYAITVRMK